MSIVIRQAVGEKDIGEIRQMFREYEKWLGVDLCFQSFERELAELPGKYVAPSGRLLLAEINEKPAGCIALRKIDEEICEMKRLFVKDEFRGQKFGKILIERLFKEARSENYRKMRLDTLPSKMPQAVGLYRKFGFAEIAPYYASPIAETLFMEANL